MIPKKIHYCWFGGNPLPRSAEKCIESWRKYCPDYEIIEWNEKNFDVNMNAYTKMCAEQKKYAFLSDYVRLLVVAENGGIYFDTDVQVLRPLNKLLSYPAFFGFENDEITNTGHGFGAEPQNPVILENLRLYEPYLDGEHGTVVCTKPNTEALKKFGFVPGGKEQDLGVAHVFPEDYFDPFDSVTGKLTKTKNTYSIHWYNMSWISPAGRFKTRITRFVKRIFGKNVFNIFKRKK